MYKGSMSPRVLEPDRRRRELLEAAARVVARRGYAATRAEDVAVEAGVAKGTVFLHFGSREGVLRALFESFEADLLAVVERTVATDAPALERLRDMLGAVLRAMAARPDLARSVLDLWAARSFAAAGQGEQDGAGVEVARLYGQYRRVVGDLLDEARREGSLRPDLTPDAPAVVVGAVEGVVLQWALDPAAVPLERVAEQVVDVLLHGLTASGGGPR
jgi:TetR/AcrR family fatty acid metabolism transcriptional regulator